MLPDQDKLDAQDDLEAEVQASTPLSKLKQRLAGDQPKALALSLFQLLSHSVSCSVALSVALSLFQLLFQLLCDSLCHLPLALSLCD